MPENPSAVERELAAQRVQANEEEIADLNAMKRTLVESSSASNTTVESMLAEFLSEKDRKDLICDALEDISNLLREKHHWTRHRMKLD